MHIGPVWHMLYVAYGSTLRPRGSTRDQMMGLCQLDPNSWAGSLIPVTSFLRHASMMWKIWDGTSSEPTTQISPFLDKCSNHPYIVFKSYCVKGEFLLWLCFK